MPTRGRPPDLPAGEYGSVTVGPVVTDSDTTGCLPAAPAGHPATADETDRAATAEDSTGAAGIPPKTIIPATPPATTTPTSGHPMACRGRGGQATPASRIRARRR